MQPSKITDYTNYKGMTTRSPKLLVLIGCCAVISQIMLRGKYCFVYILWYAYVSNNSVNRSASQITVPLMYYLFIAIFYEDKGGKRGTISNSLTKIDQNNFSLKKWCQIHNS